MTPLHQWEHWFAELKGCDALTRIKEQIVPITVVGVIFAIGYFTFNKMPPQETAGDIVVRFLLLVAFCVVFSIFPAIAIIYGWYTGNSAGAVLAGALPFPLLFIIGFFLIRLDNMVWIHIPDTILFIVILSAICGVAGYCEAQRTKNYLAASVIFTGMWLIIWMNGSIEVYFMEFNTFWHSFFRNHRGALPLSCPNKKFVNVIVLCSDGCLCDRHLPDPSPNSHSSLSSC